MGRAAGGVVQGRVSVADERKAILMRISPALWASLNRWAQDDLRSLNAQIEWLLREAVRKREGPREGAGGEEGRVGDGGGEERG